MIVNVILSQNPLLQWIKRNSITHAHWTYQLPLHIATPLLRISHVDDGVVGLIFYWFRLSSVYFYSSNKLVPVIILHLFTLNCYFTTVLHDNRRQPRHMWRNVRGGNWATQTKVPSLSTPTRWPLARRPQCSLYWLSIIISELRFSGSRERYIFHNNYISVVANSSMKEWQRGMWTAAVPTIWCARATCSAARSRNHVIISFRRRNQAQFAIRFI